MRAEHWGSLEIYSIVVDGDKRQVLDIAIERYDTVYRTSRSELIYCRNVQEDDASDLQCGNQGARHILPLCGPTVPSTCMSSIPFNVRTISGVILSQTFNPDLSYHDRIVQETIHNPEPESLPDVIVTCEFITRSVEGCFSFHFIDDSSLQQRTISNLKGSIKVRKENSIESTRCLAVVGDEALVPESKYPRIENLEMMTPIPLLRHVAAFPLSEPFVVDFDLTFTVKDDDDGRENTTTIQQSYRLVAPDEPMVCMTLDAKEKAISYDFEECHSDVQIGDEYPKIQMQILWLTDLSKARHDSGHFIESWIKY